MRTDDAFLKLGRTTKAESTHHSERAHSKFSASGSERWFNCPGSVALSEGMPDKPSVWADEGTRAHEVLEGMLRKMLKADPVFVHGSSADDQRYGYQAAKFILDLHKKNPGSDVLVEDRIYLDFIHPEMFGTYDSAVADHFGTLHVFDYKYGAGISVFPRENLQMIFYGIGLAHHFKWNFKRVRLWIIQPRVKGYDGPLFWETTIMRLKTWVRYFEKAVERVEKEPDTYLEGKWCWFCKAKPKCPLKQTKKLEAARSVFSITPQGAL